MQNDLPRVPAHLISLTGEHALRMRVDPSSAGPLAGPLPVAAGEVRPLATIDLESLRASVRIGVAPY